MRDDGNIDKSEIPVEVPEMAEEQELQKKLTPRLSEEDEQELADIILHDFHSAISDRAEWENRLSEWDDAYYNRVGDKDFPWVGCSNFNVPITMTSVETLKPRLVDAVLGQYPPIIVIPTKAADEDRKDKVETILNWQITSEMELEATVNQSAHLFLIPGMAIAKTVWQTDRKRQKYVRSFPLSTSISAILETLFGPTKPRDLEQVGELSWTGYIPVPSYEGEDLEVKIQIKPLEHEWQVLVDRDQVIEGPKVVLIEPPDLIAPAKGGHDVPELPWVQHRLWMTEDDLRRKVQLNRFYADAVEDLLDSVKQPHGDQPSMDSGMYRTGLDQTEGIEGQGPSNVRRTQYEVLEDYRRYDIDRDGYDTEIITWVCKDLPGRILGWDYLDNVYAHGRRPIRVGRYFPIPFRFYGLSLAEVVKGIQDEINAIHNSKVDYATITNLPWGFKRASSTIPPIQQRIKPGEFIDIDDPQKDIMIPQWNSSPAWGAQEEQTLYQYAERLLGLTDLSLGRQPNRVGATRTAKGTQTLLSEAGLRFKVPMQAFQRFWAGIFSDILALDQEYLPPGKEFRVTGKRPAVLKVKDRTEIRGKYDLRIAATAETLSREQMRNDATILLQAAQNPTAMQAGLVGEKGLRRVYEDLFKAYGKDPSFYLEDKAVVRSPAEELQSFVLGQYIAPTMQENQQTHLQAHQEALQDPFITPETKQLLQRHIAETLQQQQMKQVAMQMQQGPGGQGKPPVGPQATNAAQGAQPQGAQPGEPAMRQPQGAGMPGG